MAANYLGTFDATPEDLERHGVDGLDSGDWALRYILTYGGIDGAHHKDWVLDQVTRILKGTPVVVRVSKWGPSEEYPEGHEEIVYQTGQPSLDYLALVAACTEQGHDWEVGIAP
jgi:hypothetical protein